MSAIRRLTRSIRAARKNSAQKRRNCKTRPPNPAQSELASLLRSACPGVSSKLLAESAQYADGIGIGHTTTRNYSYDSLGRGNRVDTTIAEAGGFNRSYTERTTFDQYGRVFQAFDAAGGGRGTRQVYNSRGYLARIRESRGGVNGEVYWTVLAQDARGQVTEAELGNGTRLLASFDAATGRLLHKVDSTGRALAQDLELVWDAIGNLTERDARSGLADQLELFQYDVRDRLTRVQRAVNGGAPGTVQQLRYDLSGNILCKSDVSASSCTGTATNYSYASSKPHAVTSAGPRTLVYDANGNVILDRHNGITDRQFHYTTYDQLRRVSRGGQQVEFHYGANRARTLKRELEGGQIARRTHYVGAVEVVWEGSSPPVGAGEYRRMIGGVALATYHAASGVERVRYLHTDHLGSIVAISDENGLIESRTGFDAWGQRRDGADWSQAVIVKIVVAFFGFTLPASRRRFPDSAIPARAGSSCASILTSVPGFVDARPDRPHDGVRVL